MMQPINSRSDIRDVTMKPFGATGENLDVNGRHSVSFILGGRK